MEAARTGKIGDGKVWVVPVESVVAHPHRGGRARRALIERQSLRRSRMIADVVAGRPHCAARRHERRRARRSARPSRRPRRRTLRRAVRGARATSAGARVVALGSYGAAELCPGSDIDVMLAARRARAQAARSVGRLAEQLWYPLWDAGFVTGHGMRTVKESLALADDDLDALTALLDVRHVAGDATLDRRARSAGRATWRARRGRAARAARRRAPSAATCGPGPSPRCSSPT